MHFLVPAVLGALASATPTLLKRDPSDQSGKSQVALGCSSETLPDPGGDGGSGEGGNSYFSTYLTYQDTSGTQHAPDSCVTTSSTCAACVFSGNGLAAPINVTGCSFPPGAGCSIEYSYNGYDYNSETKEPKCGHENSWGPFTDTKTALCFFDV